MAKKVVKRAKRVAFEDVKIGDTLIYDDGKERLVLRVTKLNKRKGDGIDVRWKNRIDTWLFDRDFKAGHVKRR